MRPLTLSPARRPPTVTATASQSRASAPARGTSTDVAPRISAMPTARALPLAPGGAGRKRGAQDLEPEPAARERVRQPDDAARTDVDRRRRGPLARRRAPASAGARPATGSSVNCRRVGAALPLDPHVPPSCQEPIHGRGVPSNALEARNPGRPSNRAGGPRSRRARRPARRAPSSGASGATLTQPSSAQVARRGRREHTLESRLAVAAVAHERARRSRRARGRAGTGRRRSCAGRRTSARPSSLASARSAITGGRSASVACTPGICSSRMPPVIVGPGSCSTMIRTSSPSTCFSPRRRRLAPSRTG